jgi:membrane protein required for colicin V production
MVAWNWLDWVLIGIVIASTAAAAVKGFIRELISLATLVAALVIAAVGYARAAVWFEDLTKSHTIALGAGFLALFLGTMLVGAAAAVAAKKLIQTAGLQMFDRFLGGAFGLVRGVLIDCVVLMAMLSFGIKAETVQQSVLAPFVSAGARVVVLAMPRSLKEQFAEGFGRFHQTLIERDKEATKN